MHEPTASSFERWQDWRGSVVRRNASNLTRLTGRKESGGRGADRDEVIWDKMDNFNRTCPVSSGFMPVQVLMDLCTRTFTLATSTNRLEWTLSSLSHLRRIFTVGTVRGHPRPHGHRVISNGMERAVQETTILAAWKLAMHVYALFLGPVWIFRDELRRTVC